MSAITNEINMQYQEQLDMQQQINAQQNAQQQNSVQSSSSSNSAPQASDGFGGGSSQPLPAIQSNQAESSGKGGK